MNDIRMIVGANQIYYDLRQYAEGRIVMDTDELIRQQLVPFIFEQKLHVYSELEEVIDENFH